MLLPKKVQNLQLLLGLEQAVDHDRSIPVNAEREVLKLDVQATDARTWLVTDFEVAILQVLKSTTEVYGLPTGKGQNPFSNLSNCSQFNPLPSN